jgi:3'(2'), 5'-bisphosphate nucleotidase
MLETELHEARRLAVAAGEILLEHYSDSPSVEWKAPGDPVTAADRSASTFIVENLKRLFPDDAILSEEEPDDPERLAHARVWMVDPMDGTREFIARRGEFAVMIGLVVDGVPAVGAVYQPTEDKLYYGTPGAGAFMARKGTVTPLQVSNENIASRLTIAVSRSHPSSRVAQIREQLQITKSIPSGSVGLKVGLICEGLAHLYVHAGSRTSIWDTCGPDAILRAAGGRMTDAWNNPLRYDQLDVRNLHGLVATNGIIHDRVVRVTQSVIMR